MATHDHRNQVARMNAGQDFGSHLDSLGLDPSVVGEILRVLVEEGGLTWRALTRIVELLWRTPTYEQVYSRMGGTVSVTINDGGKGYTSPPDVAFTGGGGSGTTGVALLTGDAVTGVNITEYGSGYTSAPQIEFTGGGGRGAAATVSLYTPPFLRPETPYRAGDLSGRLGDPARFTSTETMLDPLADEPQNFGFGESTPEQEQQARINEQARLDRERAEREPHRRRPGR